MDEGVGRDNGSSPPAPSSQPPAATPFPFPSLPEFPLRRLTLRVSPSRDRLSRVRSEEEVQYRLAAPRIGEEVPGRGPALPPPGFLPNLCPQDLLLLSTWGRS